MTVSPYVSTCDYCGRASRNCPNCGTMTCREICPRCGENAGPFPEASERTGILNLSRTAAAIREYDTFQERYTTEQVAKLSNVEVQALEAEDERLAEAVGVAFGEDSKCINNPDTCRELVRPGPKVPAPGCELSAVRRWVAQWKEERGES